MNECRRARFRIRRIFLRYGWCAREPGYQPERDCKIESAGTNIDSRLTIRKATSVHA
jgi:hypothetical protein